MSWIVVALGGALGSLARHLVNQFALRRLPASLPAATFIVNIVGCVVVGTLTGLIASGRISVSPTARTFVFVGILGGFTTFSAFGLDTLNLINGGRYQAALINVAGQIILGLGGALIAFKLSSMR